MSHDFTLYKNQSGRFECFLLGGGTGDNPLRGRFFLRGATGIPFLRGGTGNLSGFFLKKRNSIET